MGRADSSRLHPIPASALLASPTMRDFFKTTLATIVGLTLFSGISLLGLVLLIAGLAASGQSSAPQVKDNSILTFDLAKQITDSKSDRNTRELINDAVSGEFDDSFTLRSVTSALDSAARDPKITALYLSNSSSASRNSSGYAQLKEIHDALLRFKASGKKIYAYNVEWREKEYYLASVANTIAINPVGGMEFNGLSAQTMFYSTALEKFGIGVQAIWRGKYKSAIEPYLRQRSSEPSKQQTSKLLGDIWGEYLTSAGKDRNISVPQLQALAETKGVLTPEEAKTAKLVDRVAYPDEIQDELKKISGEDAKTKSFRGISISDYMDARDSTLNDKKGDEIAVLYAEGAIVDGGGGPGSIGGDRFASQIRKLRKDDKVKAIVLRINSPGGSAVASDLIQREVILARKVKPVVVSMGAVAASGGYWIATYSDRIYAQPNTITGSIGVFGLLPNIQKIANDNGITWDVVKTGKFADAETISRPKTKEEIAIIQKLIGNIYDQFLTKVSESRKLDRAKVSEIAQGRVWSGAEALKIGLVDELGGLDDAIQDAAKRAKLGTNWHVEEYPESTPLEERLIKGLFGAQIKANQASLPSDPFNQEFKKLKTDFNNLRTLNDPQGIYLRMTDNFTID